MIRFVTLFWEPNKNSYGFSSQYDESWVEKLFRGFKRNTTYEFEFIVFTDKLRTYKEDIKQIVMTRPSGGFGYGDCIRPYELNAPMILVGLDTVITGSVDQMVEHCLSDQTTKVALPRAIYRKNTVCNGVALTPKGLKGHLYDPWEGQNDMDWLRTRDYDVLDELYPGQAVSYKGYVKPNGLGDARIVFFHGKEKPDDLGHLRWIQQNWR